VFGLGGQRSGKVSLRQKLIDGAAADESLFEASSGIAPTSWSPDGRFIAYTLGGAFPRTSDVWVLPLFGDRKPFPLVQTELYEFQAVFSPDGRWVAYTAADSRQSNVYVQPFPGAGAKYQVSRDGGSQPVWRADGKELFYLADDGTMMTVPIDAARQFNAGAPQALFRTGLPVFNIPPQITLYAVTKDGKRFLVNAIPQQAGATPLTVLVNWTAAIQK
jgi:roadblock/LC7 domain-containing protein